jgi:hypothetical protein
MAAIAAASACSPNVLGTHINLLPQQYNVRCIPHVLLWIKEKTIGWLTHQVMGGTSRFLRM